MCARLEEIPKLHAKMSNAIKRIITVISLGRKFRLLSATLAPFHLKRPQHLARKAQMCPVTLSLLRAQQGRGEVGTLQGGSGGQTLLLKTGAKRLKAQSSQAADGLV